MSPLLKYPIMKDTFMIYGLYPKCPNDLEVILWYIDPYINEYFAKEKILLTEQGVMIYQQGNQLTITAPSDLTMGVPMSIILPGLQGKNSSCTSERNDQAPRDLPRRDSEGPTRIWISPSEWTEGKMSTIIKCQTEDNRASYAINIAKALYYLSSQVAVKAKGVIKTNLINI